MNHKPLTYNRFRAYLRYKFIHQHWNKYFNTKTSILAFIVYILLSLSIYLLPNNVLTQYPYLKHFTDFMDFIPAIKQMEIKTFAPELCKFYASYMFVVGVIYTLWVFICYFYIACRQGFLSIYRNTKEFQKVNKRFSKFGSKRIILSTIVMLMGFGCFIYGFLNGRLIGYTRRGHSSTFFIDYPFEMLFYIDFWQGFMLCFLCPYIFWGSIVAINYFKD